MSGRNYTLVVGSQPTGSEVVVQGGRVTLQVMEAVVISCGTELVTGHCVDTNSAWLSERLTAHGVRVAEHITVGDEIEDIRHAVRRALERAELVIITGGLGPTGDDLTREGIAAAIGQPLEENANAILQIRTFFERWQRDMPESNRIQAMIPKGCSVIPNPRGTAPGIGYENGARRLYALPGVPVEMREMFEAAIRPTLRSSLGETCSLAACLLCYGISEAKLGEAIADMMTRGRNPLVGTTASDAVLTVRVLARGDDAQSARRLLDADCNEIRRRLGRVVFGEDDETLQGAVARQLIEQGKTIATAESCTGGMLAQRLTDIAGSSAYFLRGYVTYSNESKTQLLGVSPDVLAEHGAVSEAVASAMAVECRRTARSDFALSITGIAGPGGGSPPDKPVGLVFIGLADETGVAVRRFLMGEHLTRGEIRDRTCKTALNLLRHRLLARE